MEVRTSYGDSTRGGGETFEICSVFGLVDEDFAFTGSVAYQNFAEIAKFQRDITAGCRGRPDGIESSRANSQDELARYVGLSRRQLQWLFRKHLRCAPSRYYLKRRVLHARNLLQGTRMNMLV
jgi:AraC-like DNA-binding protein